MNVLSLFDGMSCGQIALNRVGFNIKRYYASEVNKHAIKETMANFPKTIQIGDVKNINPLEFKNVDLIIGGSPCQSFSFSGKHEGMVTHTNEEILTLEHYLSLKNENFEFKDRSYLFWEYVRVLKTIQKIKPEVKFLLENVVMSSKWEKVITKTLGVEPLKINSSLVSAQNRERLYWTNIKKGIEQPIDKGINLVDILENTDKPNPSAIRGRYINKKIIQCLEVRKTKTNKSNCITTVQKDSILTNLSYGLHIDVYGKKLPYRHYTLKELCRLQTVPDDYFKVSSESQSKKMLGNGWTVDVISHLFNEIDI